MKKFFGKLLAFALVLVMAVGVLPDISEVSAASKPKTPKITVAASDDGASIIITIGKTKNADGYEIAAIRPGSEVFTEIKVLEENGKKKRTFTAGNLPGGTYSIKVRGYKNSNNNKVWGQYSSVQDVTITGTQKEEPVESAGYKVGDIITFGAYEQDGNWDNGKEPIEWIILSNDDSEIYIVSRYVLLAGVINPFEKGKNVTWENCSLREYLNSEFIKESFSEEEAAVISETELSDAGTTDRVFLLAEDDVKLNDAIFLRDMDRRCSPTVFAYEFDKVWTCNIDYSNYHATNEGKASCYWWLRNNKDGNEFSMVSETGKVIKDYYYGGEIDTGHSDEDDGEQDYAEDFGVRPALKIKLTDEAEKLLAFSGENIAKEVITTDSIKDNIVDITEAEAGDIIVFGSYEQDNNLQNGPEPIKWVVLSKTGSKLMLLSKYCLERIQYNTEKTAVTWEKCSLRRWLNKDFYKTAFTAAERNMIRAQSIENPGNKQYKSAAEDNTVDKVFILSIDEAFNKEYGFSEENSGDGDINKRSALTEYAKAKGAQIGEYKTSEGIYGGFYWLRTNGSSSLYAVYISSKGMVVQNGTLVNKTNEVVRPVIVIDVLSTAKTEEELGYDEYWYNEWYSEDLGQTVKGCVIDATSGIVNAEGGKNLLDDNKYTKFCFKDKSGYIIWEAPEKIEVKSYALMTGNDTKKYKGRNPKSWVLYGANTELSRESEEWEVIHSVSNSTKIKAKNYKEYSFNLKTPAKAYKYFKLEILDNNGDECTQLSEFTLKGNSVE